MTSLQKVNLTEALASFDDVYSPRVVAKTNDYDVRIAHTRGEHIWHTHQTTDEFFLILEGSFQIDLRDADGNESSVHLLKGDVFTVPKGMEHRPSSTGGSILMFEPSTELSTGDADRSDLPVHIDSTTGHQL